MLCPHCGGVLAEPSPHYKSRKLAFIPVLCPLCEMVLILESDTHKVVYSEAWVPTPERLPPIRVGTPIYLNNREHKLFLEQGVVISKDHNHYRILVNSLDVDWNGAYLWVPEHWVKELPTEMRRS